MVIYLNISAKTIFSLFSSLLYCSMFTEAFLRNVLSFFSAEGGWKTVFPWLCFIERIGVHIYCNIFVITTSTRSSKIELLICAFIHSLV